MYLVKPRKHLLVGFALCLDGVAIEELRQLFEGDGQFDIESILTGELLPKTDIRRDTRDRLKKILFKIQAELSHSCLSAGLDPAVLADGVQRSTINTSYLLDVPELSVARSPKSSSHEPGVSRERP